MNTSLIRTIHQDLVNKKYTCIELITRRIALAKENKQNANVLVLEESALEKAAQVDIKIARGEEIGLLEWIPFGAKDTFLVEGTVATGAAQILQSYVSPYTATSVQKLLDAGAILLVKENCDAFGHGSSTENTMHGPTKNALDEWLVAGGSSGGSAVNVAADVTVFSLGEDTGWSIRQPAWYNQVYGHKVSYGMVSRYGCMAYASSLDTIWPIARSLEDIDIVLHTIAGVDTHDMTTSMYEEKQVFLSSVSQWDTEKLLSRKNTPIKVGYYTSFFDTPALDPTIKAAVQKLFDTLTNKWIQVVPLSFFDDKLLVSTYYTIAMAETSSNLSRIDGIKYGQRVEDKDLLGLYMASRDEGFPAETKRRIVVWNQVLSQGFLDKYYQKALLARKQLSEKFTEDFTQVDFIISPVTPNIVPAIWQVTNDPLTMYMSDLYTVGFSLWQLPTVTLPGKTPTWIQITGSYGTDYEVIRMGQLIETYL